MPVSKVVYNRNTLIDLTHDTVTSDTLFSGRIAHQADGTIIVGTLFEGYPDRQSFFDKLQDSNERYIMDSTNDVVQGETVYQKV